MKEKDVLRTVKKGNITPVMDEERRDVLEGITEDELRKRSIALHDAEYELEFLSMIVGDLGDLGYVPDSAFYIGLGTLIGHVQGDVRIAMGRPADGRWGDPAAET
jgi:hypothetical protein